MDFPYATLPYQFYGCEDPPPVERRTGNIHVARVMRRRIFGLPRQRLDKLSLNWDFKLFGFRPTVYFVHSGGRLNYSIAVASHGRSALVRLYVHFTVVYESGPERLISAW